MKFLTFQIDTIMKKFELNEFFEDIIFWIQRKENLKTDQLEIKI